MSQKYEKLKTLLKELFQLDQPDLDFGLYRIMHAKSAEVSQFLDQDLLPQVKQAFALFETADRAEIEKELAKAIEQAQGLGVDPETTQKVKDLRARLASEAVDLGALESEVYDHLYSFFRRYYSEGDFLSKRVYKPGVYAIPYEGEEVKLHWANADQYYIKTSEYLRDYAFRLRPENEMNSMRVHFRLVDAAEGEHGNVKAAEGKDRRFKLAEADSLAIEDGELIVRFTYQPDPAKQKDLNAAAESTVLATTDQALAEWIGALSAKHRRADGTESDNTRLRVHLDRYTARNTFDYFIHKDLGTFLRRELDFYVKNEVMHLDDIENESVPRVEQYLSKIKVIRRIAGKIIDFLAQLEDFQKKLWLKKKFVVETQWCIRMGCIPEAFNEEIAANDALRKEWEQLGVQFSVFGIQKDKEETGPLFAADTSLKTESLNTEHFLKAHPTLMVDTRHFDADFTARLLDVIDDVDEQTDGVLFHSENFQALSLMQARNREQVKCIYIDPPYNTGGDGFAYKDNYRHSSWASLLVDRLERGRSLQPTSGALFVSLDDNEVATLREIGPSIYGPGSFVAACIWQKNYAPKSSARHFSEDHDYILVFAKEAGSWSPSLLARTDEQNAVYRNPDNDPRGPWRPNNLAARNYYSKGTYSITCPSGRVIPGPPSGSYWRVSEEKFKTMDADGRIWWGANGNNIPAPKIFLAEVKDGRVPQTLWLYKDVGHTQEAKKELIELIAFDASSDVFATPKPSRLIERVLRLGLEGNCGTCCDYFAGSGTTGHAVINLNREDGGRRKFILVEMGDHFDTVLLPRIKKVIFTPEWRDGKPKRLATPEEAERSPRIVKVVRLESYEDTLNNLETRRSETQQSLLDLPQAQGADGLKEQYILRYMLDVETRGSQSLLNVQAFTDPTAYQLKVKRPGSDESREVNVDLLETFNWLIGLTVKHIAAPQSFSAALDRDSEKRLRLKGRLKQGKDGTYWFRTVTGTTPDGRKVLVIWRKLTGNPEEDNLVLDEWFTKQGYSAKDSEFDLIYVNGGNNLENLKTPDDLWKVRLIEEDFHRLMFETEGA